MPAVFQFLGYDPFPEPVGYPARLLAKRRREGWNMIVAAARLGTDYHTWGRWERGETIPRGRWRYLLDQFLAN